MNSFEHRPAVDVGNAKTNKRGEVIIGSKGEPKIHSEGKVKSDIKIKK